MIAHGVVVGLGDTPNRGYALELAQRGYVTLAPNYPLLAKYQPDWKQLGWESGTLKAVWDNMRGLDLLASLPFVDHSNGFGAIGHSLGGCVDRGVGREAGRVQPARWQGPRCLRRWLPESPGRRGSGRGGT